MISPPALLLSCEHGGNRIPKGYKELFLGKARLLRSHRAFDAGSLSVARRLAECMKAPLFSSEISRLLVDLNRSLHHRNLFSEISRELPATWRNRVLNSFYHPYRGKIVSKITYLVSSGSSVVHISLHTFVPVLDETVRNADVGLLYDPRRSREKEFCRLWKGELGTVDSTLRARCNYPYLGKADGLTTWLRRQFAASDYLGIELELNQRLFQRGAQLRPAPVSGKIAASLSQTWERWKKRNG